MDMTLTLPENDRGHPSISASQYLLSRSVGLISGRIRRTGQLTRICLRFCLLQNCKQISNAKMKGLSSDSCSGSRWSLLSWDNSNIPGLSRPRRSVMIPLILIFSKRLFFLTTFISYKWALGLNNTNSSHETEFFHFALYGLLLERQRCHPTWNGFLLVKEGSLCYKPNKVRCMLWKTSHILWNFPREPCCAFLPVYKSAVTLNISLNNSHKPVLIHFYVCPSEIFLYTKSNLNLGRKNWNTLITEIYYFF